MMLHFLSLSSCSVLWTLPWMPRRWCFVVLMLPSFSCYTTFLPWFKWLNLPPSTSFVLHFPFLEKEKSLHVISSTREFNFQAKNQRRGNDHSLDHLVFVTLVVENTQSFNRLFIASLMTTNTVLWLSSHNLTALLTEYKKGNLCDAALARNALQGIPCNSDTQIAFSSQPSSSTFDLNAIALPRHFFDGVALFSQSLCQKKV